MIQDSFLLVKVLIAYQRYYKLILDGNRARLASEDLNVH